MLMFCLPVGLNWSFQSFTQEGQTHCKYCEIVLDNWSSNRIERYHSEHTRESSFNMQSAQNQLASDYINLQIVNIYVIHISIARVCTLHRGCIAYTL